MSQNARRHKLSVAAGVFVLCAISSVAYAWTAPSTAPTGGNTPAPLNVGSVSQFKTGPFGATLGSFDYVGVGVAAPVSWAKMQVNGNFALSGNDGAGHSLITSEAGGLPLMFKARGGNTPDLVVATNGNVGIGTDNPRGKLHIEASEANVVTYDTDQPISATRPAWKFGSNGGNFLIQSTTDYTSYVPRMLVDPNGNVGIGTVSPGAKLYVQGGQIKVNEAEGGSGELRVGAAWGYPGIYGDGGSRPLVLGSATGRVFVNANLGVGTDNPAQKLDVAGAAKADYLVVDPQDGGAEGGEMQLLGASSYSNIQLDNYAGNFRFHTLAPGKVVQIIGGAGLQFPDGSVQSSAGGFTTGMIMMFWAQGCPGGWTELSQAVNADLRGRYPIIGSPGKISNVVGSRINVDAYENRATGYHTHNYVRGGFNWNVPTDKSGGFVNWQYDTTSGAPNNEAGQNNQVGGTNAPYVQILYCYKN